jgi:predicted DNA-binding antitoxin AbrB/MazE fold protein
MDTYVVEAIYQNGVIRPLTNLPLLESERLKVSIERQSSRPVNGRLRIIQLRGIWKDHLSQVEKDSDWVSEAISDLRKSSTNKLSTLLEELTNATRGTSR